MCASECVTGARALGRSVDIHHFMCVGAFLSISPAISIAFATIIIRSLPFPFRRRPRRWLLLLIILCAKHSHFSSAIWCDEWEFMSKRAAIITFNNSRHPLVVRNSTIYRLAIYYLTSAAGREQQQQQKRAAERNRFIANILTEFQMPVDRQRPPSHIFNRQSCCSPSVPNAHRLTVE